LRTPLGREGIVQNLYYRWSIACQSLLPDLEEVFPAASTAQTTANFISNTAKPR